MNIAVLALVGTGPVLLLILNIAEMVRYPAFELATPFHIVAMVVVGFLLGAVIFQGLRRQWKKAWFAMAGSYLVWPINIALIVAAYAVTGTQAAWP